MCLNVSQCQLEDSIQVTNDINTLQFWTGNFKCQYNTNVEQTSSVISVIRLLDQKVIKTEGVMDLVKVSLIMSSASVSRTT